MRYTEKGARRVDDKSFDILDWADLIHRSLGDIEDNAGRIAKALEAILELLKRQEERRT